MTYKNPHEYLWRLFSQYIRLRDADEQGFCTCISCLKPTFWKDCDAGHFLSVGSCKALEFNEINVNAECQNCNRFNSQHLANYAINLIKKYGIEVIESLREMKTHKVTQRKEYEFVALIQEYKQKIKELHREDLLNA